MELTWVMKGAAGAAALAGGVLLLLPPTQPKASWTSVQRAAPTQIYKPPAASEFEQSGYSAPDRTVASEPIARADPWRDAGQENHATEREIAIADDDRDYSNGYGWAAENEVEDRRECRRLSGASADGCRDYVAGLTPELREPEQNF